MSRRAHGARGGLILAAFVVRRLRGDAAEAYSLLLRADALIWLTGLIGYLAPARSK